MTALRSISFTPRRLIWPGCAVAILVAVALLSPPERLGRSLLSLGELVLEIGFAAFLGGIMEYRAWLRFVSWLAAPLIRFGRLPGACADAFMTAMVSGNAAGMMLAEHRRSGQISRREMIFGGLCNATPAMISFSLGMMLPVIGAAGLAGAIYYGITYGIALFSLLLYLLAARWTANSAEYPFAPAAPSEVLPWSDTLRRAGRRTLLLLRRVLLVTAPLYLLTALAIDRGWFNLGRRAIPPALEGWLTPETLSILAARLGGMLNAAGVAAELLRQQRVDVVQTVFVFVLGNVINNPFRTLRRSLPAALGIYPGYDGALIVTVLMGLRLLLNVAAAVAIVLLFHRN